MRNLSILLNLSRFSRNPTSLTSSDIQILYYRNFLAKRRYSYDYNTFSRSGTFTAFRWQYLTLSRVGRQVSFRRRFLSGSSKFSLGHYTSKIKDYAVVVIRAALTGALIFVATVVLGFGINYKSLDSEYPTPEEWSTLTRLYYLTAKAYGQTNTHMTNFPQWYLSYYFYKKTLMRLLDGGIDGTNVVFKPSGAPVTRSMHTLPDLATCDVSLCDDLWRQGYYEVLFGLAQAREHLEGHLLDTRRNIAYPEKYIRRRKFSRLTAIPPNMSPPPNIEDCVEIPDSPDTFYRYIISTPSFTTKQRVDAAVMFADWLSYMGRNVEAFAVLHDALDIACSCFPASQVNRIVDVKTGIILKNAPFVTANILTACTALGILDAKQMKLPEALATFLSILRSQKPRDIDNRDGGMQAVLHVPMGVGGTNEHIKNVELQTTKDSIWQIMGNLLKRFLKQGKMNQQLVTGDEIYDKYGTINDCANARIRGYIGEILFYTSRTSEQKIQASSWVERALREAIKGAQKSRQARIQANSRNEGDGVGLPIFGDKRYTCITCARDILEDYRIVMSRGFQSQTSPIKELSPQVKESRLRKIIRWFKGHGKTHENEGYDPVRVELPQFEMQVNNLSRPVSEFMSIPVVPFPQLLLR